MHLLNSSSITSCRTTSNYSSNSNSLLFSRMESAVETSRTARVLEVRAPNMRTHTKRGTLREGQLVDLTPTTAAREYLAEQEDPKASGEVAREATATEDHLEELKANTTTLLTLPASPCPASIHRVSSKHKSSHS